ncbi:hypothetical protein BDZ91DRAFT_793771 [Kalaharituber pfeilii]|nr:hypothetical protein BDZ91DRAFT_793771 [Kalaharituber pfeilii]
MTAKWFGRQDLATKYAIVLGSLIFITIVLGICKLLYTRQRTKRIQKELELNKPGGNEEEQNLKRDEEDEGDLFGIRALEKGFFGGVAQSRPVTPIASRSQTPAPSSSSLTLVPPRAAHPSNRHSSESEPMKSASHAISPISATNSLNSSHNSSHELESRKRDNTRSQSPTDCDHSQSTTIRGESPAQNSTGAGIKTYSNSPITSRDQMNDASSTVLHPPSSTSTRRVETTNESSKLREMGKGRLS